MFYLNQLRERRRILVQKLVRGHFLFNSHAPWLSFCYHTVSFMHVFREPDVLFECKCIIQRNHCSWTRHDESGGINYLGIVFFFYICLSFWETADILKSGDCHSTSSLRPFSSSGGQTPELWGHLLLWCQLQLQQTHQVQNEMLDLE